MDKERTHTSHNVVRVCEVDHWSQGADEGNLKGFRGALRTCQNGDEPGGGGHCAVRERDLGCMQLGPHRQYLFPWISKDQEMWETLCLVALRSLSHHFPLTHSAAVLKSGVVWKNLRNWAFTSKLFPVLHQTKIPG